MKIVLTDAQTVVDNLVPADRLSQFGEVVQYGLLTYDEVAEKIADADMVICNKTRLDEGSLKLAKNLKYIGLFATGYNNIDIEYCRKHGITVCNAGSYSTNAVAELAFGLAISVLRNIPACDAVCRRSMEKEQDFFAVCISAKRACRKNNRYCRIWKYRKCGCKNCAGI